jgi:hypothetical protein
MNFLDSILNWLNPKQVVSPVVAPKPLIVTPPVPVTPIVILTPAVTPSVIVVTADYQLSPHYTYGMFVRTEHREYIKQNFEEGKKYFSNMAKLCNQILEPEITLLGEVPDITSCFRCLGLNTAIHASATSQHMEAEAGDQRFKRALKDAFNKIAWSNIQYSQIILEFDSWVHVGFIDEVLHPGKKFQKFIASSVDGKTVYTPVTKPL